MGSQRYLAEDLLGHFDITEKEAYGLVRLVEATQLGDALSDAVWPLREAGDIAAALASLEEIQVQLGTATSALRTALSALTPRRKPSPYEAARERFNSATTARTAAQQEAERVLREAEAECEAAVANLRQHESAPGIPKPEYEGW